jgi:hypothetical protein
VTGVFVVAFIAIAGLAWVAAPLRWKRFALDDAARARSEAESNKRAALAALLDLEDELRLGKISEDDFAVLHADYEAEALVALRELDLIDASASDPMEADIAAARERLTCPKCGAPRRAEKRCPRCGA